MGIAHQRAIAQPAVFLTHGHIDHFAAIHQFAGVRNMQRMSEPAVLCPGYMTEPLESMLTAVRAMDGSAVPARVCGMEVGQVALRPILEFGIIEELSVMGVMVQN
jgi:ribonuclease Z